MTAEDLTKQLLDMQEKALAVGVHPLAGMALCAALAYLALKTGAVDPPTKTEPTKRPAGRHLRLVKG